MQVRFYATSHGSSPVEGYLDKLEEGEAAHVLAVLKDLEVHGLEGSLADRRQVKGKLHELKLRQHRIFFVALASEIVLLHAYKKEKQRAPKKEIQTAEKRMTQVLRGE